MRIATVLFGLLLAAGLLPCRADPLPLAATVGPWRWAAQPVIHAGRVWFASANRWPDHNSADIWSIGADGSGARPERRLFSQDTGRPAVFDGLLWWPLEDPRASLGWGEVAVTDGRTWRTLQTRTGRQYHLHSVSGSDGGLLLAGSERSALVLSSIDGGVTWRSVFAQPWQEGRFSRTYAAHDLGHGIAGDLYRFGDGRESGDVARLTASGAVPVTGWPDGAPVARLVRTGRSVTGIVIRQDGVREIWRTDLKTVTALPPLPEGLAVDLAVDGDRLHALAATEPGGRVWRLDGDGWTPVAEVPAGEVLDLAVAGGRPVVAGGLDGKGALWMAPLDLPAVGAGAPPLPAQYGNLPVDRDAALQALRGLMADRASYRNHGEGLRDGIDQLLVAGLPGTALADLLDGPFPEGDVSLVGGRNMASYRRFGRWIILNAMRVRGAGQVPPALIALPFDEAPSASEKYFGEAVAAIVAAGAIGQDDPDTVAALRAQAAAEDNPDWLRADAREALRRITGRRGGERD